MKNRIIVDGYTYEIRRGRALPHKTTAIYEIMPDIKRVS